MEESTNDSYPDGHVNVAHQLDFPPLEKNYQVASKQPISSKRKRHISKVATHLEVYSNDYYPDGDVHRTESLHLENQHPDSKDQDNKNKPIASKRRRRIPKVYTPNGSENTVYCLCQQENCRWYIVCNVQKMGCLMYYHPECVGLEWMKSPNDAKIYSNCPDGESYKCPICSIKEEPDENTEKFVDI